MSTITLGSPDMQRLEFQISQADLIAHTTQYFVVPQNGFLDALFLTTQYAVTTGGTIALYNALPATFNVEGGLDTTSFINSVYGDTLVPGVGNPLTVANSTITIGNTVAAGVAYSTFFTEGDPSVQVTKGQVIAINITGFATAGSVNGYFTIRNTMFSTPQ